MHRDTKLGLALGILLLGSVGAFFFRNEPLPSPDVPELKTAESLDAQIADQPHAPYITGLEPVAEPDTSPSAKSTVRSEPPRWEIPDFLKDNADPFRPAGAPDPIRPREAISAANQIPAHNAAWTPDPPGHTVAKPTAPESTAPTLPSQRIHVVQTGDTLSELAVRYLGSATRFGELFAANRDQLQSPDDLRVGMKLKIPTRSATGEGSPASSTDPPVASPATTDKAEAAQPKVRFQPVSRTPFSPRTVAPNEAGGSQPRPTRSLSQRPPVVESGLKDD